MNECWIKCSDRLPPERPEGSGSVSDSVIVLLSNGKETDDFLINGRWVFHCKLDNVGGYPVAWREFDGKRT